jgi:hypothetical protein
MSENRENEARSWDDAEADADRAVTEMKQSLDRLRGQVGEYRTRVGDNDNTGDSADLRRYGRPPHAAGCAAFLPPASGQSGFRRQL